MNTLNIPKAYLFALYQHVSTDSLRPAMKGIMLEPSGDGSSTVCVATNGKTLLALMLEGQAIDRETVIPPDMLKQIGAHSKTKIAETSYTLSVDWPEITVSVSNGGTFSGMAVDESFPQWRGVIPDEYNNTPGQFDAEYIAAFGRSAFAFRGIHQITMRHNGPFLAALVSIDGESDYRHTPGTVPEHIGLVMPYMADPSDDPVQFDGRTYGKKHDPESGTAAA